MSILALTLAAPLLIKASATGFVPVEWSHSEKCEVYANKVVLTKTYGGKTVSTTYPFSGEESVKDLIEEASHEELQEDDNYRCDGPSTTISAGELLIYSTGGCGSPKKSRQGPGAHALTDIIGTFCPTTH